jgi:DNA-binding GntR family transcriptional regulator
VTPTPRPSRGSAVDRLAAEVLRRLRDGELAPGQRLIESELVAEFGAGRSTVREALSRLAAEGHLVLERNRGAVVRRMSADDVRELYQLREILEGAAAGLAARHIDEPGHRARMEEALAENRRLVDVLDLPGYIAHNERFHALVVELARSALLAELVGQLRTRAFRLQFRRLATAEGAAASAAQHDAVGKAVLAGDAETAERVMREHVRASGEDILARHHEPG